MMAQGQEENDELQVESLRIEASLAATLNLAAFQNAVPVIADLHIANDTDAAIADLELCVASEPAFFQPKSWRIDELGARARYQIPVPDLALDGSLLGRLTEAETATVSFVLRTAAAEPAVIARQEVGLILLPRNQWGGLSSLPDLAAAFVQPNEPAVERLLKQTADVLRRNGKNPALDGYAGGARRAWELASGIWSAVASMGLDYALPPASFEYAGQKVRGAGQITESGLATCMDLALLFCSALEQAGLNPLLIFTRGHAFAGVWLKQEAFSTTVVDDVTALRKRVRLKELVLFETTLIAQRPAPLFSHAVKRGARQIAEDHDETFELAVDIRRARMQRIKPLASVETSLPHADAEPVAVAVVELAIEEALDLPDESAVSDTEPAALDPKDRLARWQRKLLDLSLRNNLLNFKEGKRAIRLDAPEPGQLEDLLATHETIKLQPRPDLMDGADPRNQALYEEREREDVRRAHALDALTRREVFVGLARAELETRLIELYRAARNTLQEGGANTLYVALGFLSWTRDEHAERRYRAPLILIPVTLQRRSVRSGFTLVLHDDEPRFNPTLIEMLRQDFRLGLGVAEGELPRDDAGLDVDMIWASVEQAIKDIKGWEVSREVVLSTFSFAKYLMWKDLAERTDQLRQNAVVRHLLDTPRESFASRAAFPDSRQLDRDFTPQQIFCPLPADSSQLSAVMAAARGKDFVLIGPPGTGKSQTIANLIAQSIADGKRVLFVSEKIAALDVVYRRLREVNLGEFCLELHSNKARKVDVLAQLNSAWEARGEADVATWHVQADRLAELRNALNVYVQCLHRRHDNGCSIYVAIGQLSTGADLAVLGLSWPSHAAHDVAAMTQMRDVTDRLEVNAQAIGHRSLKSHALAAIGQLEWSPTWQQRVVDAARSVLPIVREVQKGVDHFVRAAGLPACPDPDRRAVQALDRLARHLPSAAGQDWGFVLRPDARLLVERLREGLDLIRRHRELSARLSTPWSSEIATACERGLQLLDKRGQLFAQLAEPWSATTVARLNQGLTLLARVEQCKKALSVGYTNGIGQLDVIALQQEWTRAEQSIWPKSWLGKRGIRARLSAVIAANAKPDIAKDLATWIEIRELHAKIRALDPGTDAVEVWKALDSEPDSIRCVLHLQPVLAAVRQNEAWGDQGFEAIAAGRCGKHLRTELARIRALRLLEQEIAKLVGLEAATGSLWAGLSTSIEKLRAALAFQCALRDLGEEGRLAGTHEAIARGDAGAALASDWQALNERARLEKSLLELDDLRPATGGVWKGLRSRFDEVDNALDFHAHITAAVAGLATTPERMAQIKAPLQSLLGDANSLLEAGGAIADAARGHLEACGHLPSILAELSLAACFTDEGRGELDTLSLGGLLEKCESILQSEPRLRAWSGWRRVRSEALALGLAPLVVGMEEGKIGAGDVRRSFETNYCRWWLNAVVDHEPVIRDFVSAEHEKRIRDFCELDERFTALTRDWLRARLCAELPDPESVGRSSEWGVLRHEIGKKSRHLPLRELMSRAPTVLTKLSPCLLMSPLSIAQYLPPDASAFDLVVFDEASQIPVWDAIGAIARGKQVVMVGDPKQLPPTAFFDRADAEGDEDEEVEADLESILDECIAANLPTRDLNWHYRSRHESLIAFSNHRYYDDKLVTFPSPVTDDRALSLHPVHGTYEKGASRTNAAEAKALVADLVARLRSHGFRESKLTIGVVTFNSEQQRLIEDLLDDARRQDPSLEPYFEEAELEPLFVKNLESVQGDERDIMYFSITYGPDRAGVLSMNFGPLNRHGGERRLNVAITRARQELRVFTSLRADQMDLARTNAAGVRDLKHFLEFAARGPRALAEGTSGSIGGYDSPLEQAVAAALAERGWRLHTQVGASQFRIDLGVVDPDAHGRYLAGIECDGATYHRSATARDRDKLREQVLRGLGWDILRIWSTDWWIEPADVVERIDARLRDLLDIARTRRAEEAARAEAEQQAAEEAALLATESALAKAIEAAENEAAQSVPKPSVACGDAACQSRASQTVAVDEEIYAKFAPVDPQESAAETSALYVEADPTEAVDRVDPDAFFADAYTPTLTCMIAHVVDREGPILDAVLARRIARAHGWLRTGARIRDRVVQIAHQAHQSADEDVGTFFWPSHLDPVVPLVFRYPADERSIRSVDEISLQELAALAREVEVSGKSGEEALYAMARELGLQQLRAASRGRLEKVVVRKRG